MRMWASVALSLCVVACLFATTASAATTLGTPHLTRDFNDAPAGAGIMSVASVGDTVYFTTSAEATVKLWKTSGDYSSATPVSVLEPYGIFNMTGTATKLYFVEPGGPNRGLWVSDGTTQGAHLIVPAGEVTLTSIYGLTSDGDTVYFNADDGVHGRELWHSDGTNAGTAMVKDINAGAESSNPQGFVKVGSMLYFEAVNGTTGSELWVSDGTSDGTTLVKDINAGASYSFIGDITAFNGGIAFYATDSANGTELWVSDGTSDGTTLVKDINPGVAGSEPTYMVVMGPKLYFCANSATDGFELWASDGTELGTALVKDIVTGSASSYPRSLTVMNNTLYFGASDIDHGYELFKSDGTDAGTELVKDINPGASYSSIDAIQLIGGKLYFFATTAAAGRELWTSDGTANGTVLTRDIQSGTIGSVGDFSLTAVANGQLFFPADDGIHGAELWRSQGTLETTQLVHDARTGTADAGWSDMFAGNSALYGGNQGNRGFSDGTSEGTRDNGFVGPGTGELRIGVTGPSFSLWSAYDVAHGYELWRTDDSAAGTSFVADINPGAADSLPGENDMCIRSMVAAGAIFFFSADDGTHGNELWKSDGTAGGTSLVYDINPGSSGSYISSFIAVGGEVYFYADDGTHGAELWRSDGTEVGTNMVKDIVPGSDSSFGGGYQPVAAGGSSFYFAAQTPGEGVELWISDGTEAGTTMVADIDPGAGSGYWGDGAVQGSMFVFAANDGVHGFEPWRTDGTEAGTQMLGDVAPGPDSSSTGSLFVSLTDRVVFTATSTAAGPQQLWRTTADATAIEPVFDTLPSPSFSVRSELFKVGSQLVFAGSDTSAGSELWVSDGSAAGTHMTLDINAGPGSSAPLSFIRAGANVFFSAFDAEHGRELWAIPLIDSTIPPAPAAVFDGASGSDRTWTTSATALAATWTAAAGADHYQLCFSSTANGADCDSVALFVWHSINDTAGGASQLTLADGSTWYACVRSVSATGFSSLSVCSNGQTVDVSAPTGASISYLNGASSVASANVTFVIGSDAGTITEWHIERRTAPLTAAGCGATWSAWSTIGGALLMAPFVDTPLTDRTCYQWHLVVHDAAGNAAVVGNAAVLRVQLPAALPNTLWLRQTTPTGTVRHCGATTRLACLLQVQRRSGLTRWLGVATPKATFRGRYVTFWFSRWNGKSWVGKFAASNPLSSTAQTNPTINSTRFTTGLWRVRLIVQKSGTKPVVSSSFRYMRMP